MSKKITQKVHGELRAARPAKAERKRQAKQSETGGEQHPEQDRQETPVAAKGREHAIAKSMPRRTKPTEAATPDAPTDDGELVVFAFRLSRAERDLIHAAAGSAKASKFVRGLAIAAARGDVPATREIVDSVLAKMK